ncbi:MAG TPA: methyltransferase domain-containing protein, partial [Ilumatobacteraceae bacterium]
MPARTDSLLKSIDVATAKGLELGPLINPVVRKDMGDVRYIDHVDTDALRARYATHVGFDVDAIVPIDYVSNGSIRDAVGGDIPFDYVIASHVIEHVPDVIGWFADIRSVLRDDGVLSLAIPDHRRCFDALRSPTVTADLIEAYLTKPTIPSPRQVFDHYSAAVAWRGMIAWEEEPPFSDLVLVH